MKTKMRLAATAVLLIVVIIFCSFFAENYISVTKKLCRQAIVKQDSNENITTYAPVKNNENKELRIQDFIPSKTMTKQFSGGFENGGFKQIIDKIDDDKIQVKQMNTGMRGILIYQVSDKDVRLIFSSEVSDEKFKENYIGTVEPNSDEIILKEPLEVGTKWTKKDNVDEEYEITGIDVMVKTPAGTFSAVEVTFSRGKFVTKSYYVKNLGLVKTSFGDYSEDVLLEIKASDNTPVEKEKDPLEFKEKLLVDNKPVLDMSYSDVIKNFGKPINARTEKILFPASSPEDYDYVEILSYDGIDFEFDLGFSKSMRPVEECKVWRFDLTSDKYNIGDLKVGMSIEEYQRKFTNSKIYTLSDLLNTDSDKLSDQDRFAYNALERVIIMPKPKDYYSKYEKVSYQQGVLVDKDGNSVAPLGFGILIKDNKIDRIVYGFPTAS